ncbi:MAG TPA: FxLYD domain-containing protein [Gemmatimonadaceae bacterium]|nr:FxLYD domain-containing protein [Gemmatimonadaceae bacterium]
MNVWGRAATWALALGALTATAGKAQDKQEAGAACNMQGVKSGEVKDAYNTVTVMQLGKSKPEDAKKKLGDAVGNLTKKDDFGKDQLQRNFVLGSALVMLYEQPGQAPVAPASSLGFKSGGDASVDLLKTADSLFTTVESADASCKDQTSYYRQRPWAQMINEVGPLISANKLDSAQALLDRSLIIYRDSPFSYYFKGQIAQQKEDWKTAQEAFGQAVELSDTAMVAKDSNIANVKEFSEFARAFSAFRGAQGLSGDQQKEAMKSAADLYRQYLKDYPNGPNTQPAQAGLTAALQSAGDTESLTAVWTDMAANPSNYKPEQLYDAGVQAFSAEKYDQAVKLMELGEQGNPYLRAGLFNLANAYWKNNQFDKMVPVARKLIEIDPDNPDNYQLLAIGYQGLGKAAKDPKAQKQLSDSVSKYVVAADKLPVKVTVANFTHDDSTKHTLTGSVENLGAAPKNVSLAVQFLDKSGTVVDTQTAALSLKPNASSEFTLTANGAGIVAYRYEAVK